MLSVIVVKKDTGIPGKGFFTLANELGRYDGRDEISFFERECKKSV